ncbi:MAG: GntR family transcriptional regulator [Clostridia bacterium]|nr:GntR family transcriptional regulator [Clostridia bacterium]
MPKGLTGKRDVYIEVAERYEKYIRIGVLRDGDKLPSVRVAANELGVNPNTVQ